MFSRLLEGLIGGPCNVGEMSTAKNSVRLFSVVSEVFENLLNNKIVDSLKKRSFFCFPVWF